MKNAMYRILPLLLLPLCSCQAWWQRAATRADDPPLYFAVDPFGPVVPPELEVAHLAALETEPAPPQLQPQLNLPPQRLRPVSAWHARLLGEHGRALSELYLDSADPSHVGVRASPAP